MGFSSSCIGVALFRYLFQLDLAPLKHLNIDGDFFGNHFLFQFFLIIAEELSRWVSGGGHESNKLLSAGGQDSGHLRQGRLGMSSESTYSFKQAGLSLIGQSSGGGLRGFLGGGCGSAGGGSGGNCRGLPSTDGISFAVFQMTRSEGWLTISSVPSDSITVVPRFTNLIRSAISGSWSGSGFRNGEKNLHHSVRKAVRFVKRGTTVFVL